MGRSRNRPLVMETVTSRSTEQRYLRIKASPFAVNEKANQLEISSIFVLKPL